MTAYSIEYLEESFDKIYLLRNNYYDNEKTMKEFINNIDEFSVVANGFLESLDFQKSFNEIKNLIKLPLSESTNKLITQLISLTMIKIKKMLFPDSNLMLPSYSAFTTKSPIVYRRNEQKA
jgi:hypothetical protein